MNIAEARIDTLEKLIPEIEEYMDLYAYQKCALQAALQALRRIAEDDKARDELPFTSGDTVYAVESEGFDDVEISRYMFLASVGHGAILTPFINDLEDLEGTVDYHINESAESYTTDVVMVPLCDVYGTRQEAEAALGD